MSGRAAAEEEEEGGAAPEEAAPEAAQPPPLAKPTLSFTLALTLTVGQAAAASQACGRPLAARRAAHQAAAVA